MMNIERFNKMIITVIHFLEVANNMGYSNEELTNILMNVAPVDDRELFTKHSSPLFEDRHLKDKAVYDSYSFIKDIYVKVN